MKIKLTSLPFLFLLLIGTSCIKDEALNAEADILSSTIENAEQNLSSEPFIRNNSVQFEIKRYKGDYIYAPTFELTPGATIEPESGTERDFSEPQEYIVTSESTAWKKTYTVSFTIQAGGQNLYSFENVDTIETKEPIGKYHEFYEFDADNQKVHNWDTANEGYNIMAESEADKEGVELNPAFYPTSQTKNGYQGKGVKLQTKDTGSLGAIVNSPLAAGNLFLGDFKLTFPPIKSPRFGRPYNYKGDPVLFKGYYKYKAGKDFKINAAEGSSLSKDTFDAYAILFEKQDHDNYLQGGFNFEDARMVSMARIKPEDRKETEEWTAFEIPFEPVNGKTFDPDKEYMFTIVFSSSLEGDLFNGAVGSTLWVDEVEIITDDMLAD